MPRLINVAHTKAFLLAASKQYKNGKFERVSAAALDYLDGKMRQVCTELVRTHPSMGKTIQSPFTPRKPDAED